jgi:hypothetical protein
MRLVVPSSVVLTTSSKMLDLLGVSVDVLSLVMLFATLCGCTAALGG